MPPTRRLFERLEPRTMLSADPCPGASLQGAAYLLDESGTPVALPDAEIRLLDEQGAELATTTTDSAGAYAFQNLSPGIYALHQPPLANLTDAGSSVGNGGGIALADNLLADIPVACGDALAGYDFQDANQTGFDDGGPPPLRLHSKGVGENVILQPTGLLLATVRGAADAMSLVAPPSALPPQDRGPEIDAVLRYDVASDANIAASRQQPAPAEKTPLVDEVFSSDLIIDKAVDAVRWFDDAWDRFSKWQAESQSKDAADAEASASAEASPGESPAPEHVAERDDPTSET